MGWSSDLNRERRIRGRVMRARDRLDKALPRSSRPPLTAEQLDEADDLIALVDYLSEHWDDHREFCNHRTEDERRACACDCHRSPSKPQESSGGPVYRLVEP